MFSSLLSGIPVSQKSMNFILQFCLIACTDYSGFYLADSYYDALWEAYHKFKRGYQLMKEGGVMADLQDFYGWRDSLRHTMRWLGRDEKEIKSTSRDIEVGEGKAN
jgi:hypothetical protein